MSATVAISLDEIRNTHEKLAAFISRTPTKEAVSGFFCELLPKSKVFLKYELFQVSGTFKSRGVLNNLLSATGDRRGVTAASAGNHAIAVAVGAKLLGLDAKVVMQASANPARIAAARAAGAEIIIAADGKEAFAKAHEIAESEGRLFIHPFDGPRVAEAAAGVALEMIEDSGGLDAIIVSVGGGGLGGGVSSGAKLLNPDCVVVGVEPEGAAAMAESFRIGAPATLAKIDTIADSLAPPMTTKTTFELCRDNMDRLVTVSDDQMAAACYLLFKDLKIAAEPACGAATAAAIAKCADGLAGKRVGVILCGSNIDIENFSALVRRGEGALARGALSGD